MPFLPSFSDEDDPFLEEPTQTVSSAPLPKTEDQRARVAIRALRQMQQQLANVLDLLERPDGGTLDASLFRVDARAEPELSSRDRMVEGVFDGQRMVGTDGMQYTIPPNYASKSKLVEGDILKLTIKEDGTFIYKQVGPIERDRVTGLLALDDAGNYALVLPDGKTYRILTASVTFYRGEPGDEIVALVPKGSAAVWAAVEHILKRQVEVA